MKVAQANIVFLFIPILPVFLLNFFKILGLRSYKF
jgi:hypothetical protein